MQRALAAIACFLFALGCEAAEWALDPSVDTRANVTDNLDLTPGVRQSVSWLSVSPALVFSRNTEATQTTGSARFTANRYPDDPSLNTEDQFFHVSTQASSERQAWGVSAAYIRDSTLQTELLTTGIVQQRLQRAQSSVTPTWQYSFTEQGAVFASYNYEQARYEDGGGLVDYSNQQISGGLQYAWDERTVLRLTGAHSLYETDDGSQTTRTSILTGGVTYKASERWDLAMSVGVRHSNIEVTSSFLVCPGSIFLCQIGVLPLELVTPTSNTSDDGWLLDGNADYKWERASAGVVIGRDVNPTGNGLLVQTDRLAGTFKYAFSGQLHGDLAATILQSRYLGGSDQNKNNYFRVDSSLSWDVTERWRLTTGYSYAYQRAQNTTTDAYANTLYMTIGYQWPRITLGH